MKLHVFPIVFVAFAWVQLVRAQEVAAFGTEKIQFVYYYGNNLNDFVIYGESNITEVLGQSTFKADRITTIYFHGYYENHNVANTQLIVSAYLGTGKYNLLVCDYGAYAYGPNIVLVGINFPFVAKVVARTLLSLFAAGLPIKQLHLVGHSLGAMVAGCAGNYVQELSNNILKLPRISGLDPAGPLFYKIDLKIVPTIKVIFRVLRPSDAHYVEAIHTDAGVAGTLYNVGHVDFWPNGGHSPMPGCALVDLGEPVLGLACSHQRSCYYWANSLAKMDDPSFFLARKAVDWQAFKTGDVDRSAALQQMGIRSRPELPGTYFLETNDFYNFSLGLEGTTFNPNRQTNRQLIKLNLGR